MKSKGVDLHSLRVADWMTADPITVSPNTGLLRAFGLLKTKGIKQLPVVKDDCLVGIVTDRDLRRPAFAEDIKSWDELYRIKDSYKVDEIMKADVVTIQADASLAEAARLLKGHKFNSLPVLSTANRLIGILSVSDILRAIV